MNRIDAIACAEGFVRSHQLPWGADILAVPCPAPTDGWGLLIESLEPVVTPPRACDCGACRPHIRPAHLELRVEPTGFAYLTRDRPPFVVEQKDRACADDRAWVTRCCRERATPGVLAVVEQIEAAFHSVKRGEVTLHQADVIDDYRHITEPEAMVVAGRRDREARWEQVPAADLEQAPVLFSFLDSKSFIYYLSAAMVWRLLHPQRSVHNGVEGLEYALDSELHREAFDRLTQPQAAAVRAFLYVIRMLDNEVEDDWEATRALASGWDQAGAPTPALYL